MSSRRSAMFKEEEWARVQPIIRKLYLLEDKSLKDVIIILSTLHGFRPSKAQLESKLKQWHMAKNMTSMEWKHVDIRIRKRHLRGKESKVYLSGIPLCPATVEKARGRHSFESTLDRITGRAPPSPEDLSLIIRTPSPPAEVRTWNTHNIPWILATDFLREFNIGTLLQSRHSISFPVEDLLSLVLNDRPKLFSHTSKLQYTMRSLALILPATHEEQHVFYAESLLLSPPAAGVNSESFELLLFLLTNNFLTEVFSIEDRIKRSALIKLLLDVVHRSRVLDFLATQQLSCLSLSLQSALGYIFNEAVRRSELNLVRQLLQCGVDVNQELLEHGGIGACTAFEYAVVVHDTALMELLIDFGADTLIEDFFLVYHTLRRRKSHASASKSSIAYILSNCRVRPEGDHLAWIDLILGEIGSGRACPVSEQVIGYLRTHLQAPASIRRLMLATVKSQSMFAFDLISENCHLLDLAKTKGRTLLTNAASRGSCQIVKHLLHLGVNPNPPPTAAGVKSVFAPPLLCAAFVADISIVRLLLDAGADINFCHSSTTIYPANIAVEEYGMFRRTLTGRLGKTALHAAILGRNTEMTLFLLAAGVRLVGGELTMAIQSRQQTIVNAILATGAPLGDTTDTEYGSVLEAAILTEDVGLISRIIEANPQAVDEPALWAAIYIARTTSNLAIIRHLVEDYAKTPMSNDSWLGTAIALAAQLGLHEISELMLTSGLHPTTCHSLGLGPGPRQIRMPNDYLEWRHDVQQRRHPPLSLITVAVGIGQLDYLKLLLRHGYQVPSLVDNILPIYPRAFEDGIFPRDTGLEILQTLHRHGTRMTSRVLSHSIRCGNRQITQWILSLSTDLAAAMSNDDLRTVDFFRTPLQAAAGKGDMALLERLRRLGANINDPPARGGGVTALQVASIKGYYGLVKRLLDLLADPNAPGAAIDGRTALEGAAEYGRLDVVQLLLNSGVETCGSGRRHYVRAIEFARREGYHIVVKLLKSFRPWTEADQELLEDETLLYLDQTLEGIAKRRRELEGHMYQATDDDETSGYETSEYEDSEYEDSEYEDSEYEDGDDETSEDDAEEASLNRLPASTLEETREVLRIDDETHGLPGDAIWAEAYENWSSEFPWSME